MPVAVPSSSPTTRMPIAWLWQKNYPGTHRVIQLCTGEDPHFCLCSIFFFKDYQTFSSSLCCLTCSGVSCKFKAMLPGSSYANKNVSAFLPFWKGCTGSLLRSVSITKLPHLLSGILRVPSLHTFLCFFLPTNPLKPSVQQQKTLQVPQTNLKSAKNRSPLSSSSNLELSSCSCLEFSLSLLFKEKFENRSLVLAYKAPFCAVWFLCGCACVLLCVCVFGRGSAGGGGSNMIIYLFIFVQFCFHLNLV